MRGNMLRRHLATLIVAGLTLATSAVGVGLANNHRDLELIQARSDIIAESASLNYSQAYWWCDSYYRDYAYAKADCQQAAFEAFQPED